MTIKLLFNPANCMLFRVFAYWSLSIILIHKSVMSQYQHRCNCYMDFYDIANMAMASSFTRHK